MNYLSVTNIHRYMSDSIVTASAVEQQVSRLNIRYGNRCAALGLGSRRTRQAHSKVGHYRLCKSRAVRSVGQARPSPYIGISNKL